MAIFLNLNGRKRMLNAWMRNLNTGVTFRYHLFSNNVTVSDATVLADFTESAFPGYATHDIASAGWGSPTDDGTCSTSAAADITTTSTGTSGETCYGYYVTDTADGAYIFGENFATPVSMALASTTITISPRFQTRTGTPC